MGEGKRGKREYKNVDVFVEPHLYGCLYPVFTLILLRAGVSGREFLRRWRFSRNDVIGLPRLLFIAEEGAES